MKVIACLALLLFLFSCNPNPSQIENLIIEIPEDQHSYSKPNEALTTHLSLKLKADFEQRTLEGFARYQIKNNNASELILDSKDLDIQKVTIGEMETATSFELSKRDSILGSALKIAILPDTKVVTVYYKTKPASAALGWLDSQQTAGKSHPFLYSQGQAILTRTWIPCQDSPGIRITYDAEITVPNDLLALMSAENPQSKNETGVYTFKMTQPIPPYLIAIAVGDIKFGKIGERTGVYAEPVMLEGSVYEFGDMEKMLVEAEKLYGPYLWERFDVIVLPTAFPFGGMENPRLTFATPTVIAGDRSLTSLIAHELAHSWSGNLVTNATWDDFWLNEGFTVYFERRIMEVLYGQEYTNMLALLGFQDLEKEIGDLGKDSPDTHLRLNLEGRDPDDGMTDVAYEKGAFFLTLLEQKAGRKNFDAFLKKYFNEFQFKTISTDRFISYLNKNLIEPYQIDVDINEWIFSPGIPANSPKVESDKFAKVDQFRDAFLKGSEFDIKQTASWTTHEWLHFIRLLPDTMDDNTTDRLDKAFNFSKSGNSEILAAWFTKVILSGHYHKINREVEDFLIYVGRRKFLSPLYEALVETGNISEARKIYAKARANYHAVARQTLDALLESEG